MNNCLKLSGKISYCFCSMFSRFFQASSIFFIIKGCIQFNWRRSLDKQLAFPSALQRGLDWWSQDSNWALKKNLMEKKHLGKPKGINKPVQCGNQDWGNRLINVPRICAEPNRIKQWIIRGGQFVILCVWLDCQWVDRAVHSPQCCIQWQWGYDLHNVEGVWRW